MSNHITDIAEGSDGYIWMSTYGAGLARYDGLTFEHFTNEQEISSLFYYSVCAGQQVVWFGSEDLLLKYEAGRFRYYHLPTIGPIIKIVPFNEDWIFCIGRTGSTFFSVSNGAVVNVVSPDVHFNDVVCLDHTLFAATSSGIWSFKKAEWQKEKLVADFNLENCSVIEATEQDNLLLVDRKNGLVEFSPDGLAHVLARSTDFPTNKITFLKEGALGEFFLGTRDQGILIFQPHDSLWQVLNETQLNYNDIRNLIFDRWENAWVATAGGGLVKFSSQNFTLRSWPKLSGKFFESLEIWNDTLYISYRNQKRDKMLRGTSQPLYSMQIDGQEIVALDYRSATRQWYSTTTALYYKVDSAKYQVSLDGSNNYSPVNQIVEVTPEKIYALSAGRLFRVELVEGDSSTSATFHSELVHDKVERILQDPWNRIWYHGLGEAGIVEGKTLSTGSAQIISLLFLDPNTTMVGTRDQGLLVYKNTKDLDKGQEVMVEGMKLPEIRALAADNRGRVWVCLRNEVWQLELRSPVNAEILHRYNEKVGWPRMETRKNALAINRENHIFVGTSAGLIEIHPYANLHASHGPILSVRTLKTEGQQYRKLDSTTLTSLENLGPGHTDLIISLKAIDHKVPLGISYFYQLDHHYNEWTPSSTGGEFQFLSLPPGPHLFRAKAVSETGLESSILEVPFRIRKPVFLRLWFMAVSLAICMLIVWRIYRWRLNQQLLRSRKIAETLEVQNRILRLEQDARRLQMNPHFIFNALQSIQQKITTGHRDAARLDLQSFAKMMRSFLDHSRKEYITLEDEITLLTQYLKVEQELRDHKFSFNIHVPDGIDSSFVEIPSMLIQPFVENAVKHGLPSDESKGDIRIKFEMQGKYLACIVQDNGLGYGEGKNHGHESAGISITRSRLENFFKLKERNPLLIENLTLKENGQRGTRVTVLLPIRK